VRVRIPYLIAIALVGAAAVAAFSLWRAADRLGSTVEWVSSRQPAAAPQASASRDEVSAVPVAPQDAFKATAMPVASRDEFEATALPVAPPEEVAAVPRASAPSAPDAAGLSTEEILKRLEQSDAAAAFLDPELEATLRTILEDPDLEVRQGVVELLELWLSQSEDTSAAE
jgi:hypothetical protein